MIYSYILIDVGILCYMQPFGQIPALEDCDLTLFGISFSFPLLCYILHYFNLNPKHYLEYQINTVLKI